MPKKLPRPKTLSHPAHSKHTHSPSSTGLAAYANMSESDSDQDDDDDDVVGDGENEAGYRRHQRRDDSDEPQRKKPSRKDKADSGIVEDAEPSFSSDSDLDAGTPVKHKRIGNNSGSRGGSSSASVSVVEEHRSPLRMLGPAYTGHYVDSNAFSSYMKEKIHQLPLPQSLKLYVNYNRNL